MMPAPRTGWVCPMRDSSASAGGQLEQPSEVNSSTRSGVDAVSGVFDASETTFVPTVAEPLATGRRAARARNTTTRTKTVIVVCRRFIKLLPETPLQFATSYSITE